MPKVKHGTILISCLLLSSCSSYPAQQAMRRYVAMTSAPVRTRIPATAGEMINGLVFFAQHCLPNASLAPPVETSDYLYPDGTVDLEIKTQISPGGSYHFVPVKPDETLVRVRGAIGAMILETYSDPETQARSVLLAYARAGGDDRCHPLQLPPRTLPKP